MEKKVTVAKGVKIPRGKEEKMKDKPGSSSTGKYKTIAPEDFAGAKGGSSKYSFPINSLKRARNALARAHFAPNPKGIEAAVYAKYPELKDRAEKREGKHESKSKDSKDPKKHKSTPKKTVMKNKVERVMHEYKEGSLHSGSKKGPEVTNPKQAIAIALSESRKAVKKSEK